MNSKFTFALPNNYDYDVKKFAKQVKTKKWVNTFKNDLYRWGDRLTTANIDNRQIIGGMLQAAFGANIGRQVEEKLSDQDLAKIRLNIIQVIYK
jgi:hypothetical protein